MRHISVNRRREAEHADIFSWDPYQSMENSSNLMVLFIRCVHLRFVVASAAEAELGALFLNYQEGMIFKSTLEDLGHHN